MDFTREPIIETIITPRDGCKLVIRSSKGIGQEEYFVDAVEVVCFGHAFFFRSLERPKAFLVPISDYEVLEVREARMVLKNVGPDRSIKIGGGRESALKAAREAEKEAAHVAEEAAMAIEGEEKPTVETAEPRSEVRLDKKRDRRRQYRKRRNGKEEPVEQQAPAIPPLEEGGKVTIQAPVPGSEKEMEPSEVAPLASSLLSSLLQPPPTLISETINRYRENALFKSAFFVSEDEQFQPHGKTEELLNEEDDFALQEPAYEPQKEESEPASPEDESLTSQESSEQLVLPPSFSEEENSVEETESKSINHLPSE